MGTGSRYYRAALGQATGEAEAIQAHTLAMIPITQEKAEMEFEIQSLSFAQQIEQTEALYLLANRYEDKGQQPVFVPRTTIAEPPPAKSKYLTYIGLAVLAWFLWKGI